MKTAIQTLQKLVVLLSLCNSVAYSHTNASYQRARRITIDSNLTFTEAVGDQNIPDDIKSRLCLVNVRYYSFDRRLHQGQLVIHDALKKEVVAIFKEIERSRFPIAKVVPISRYGYSDKLSMQDNNSSAFNYRLIEGSSNLSNHALGRAIDLNPLQNPITRNGVIEPNGASYNSKVEGTIVSNGGIVRAFKKRGWKWGGDWKTLKDYQHFEK